MDTPVIPEQALRRGAAARGLASTYRHEHVKSLAGPLLRQCLNPACLAWFASWGKLGQCSKACDEEFHAEIRSNPNVRMLPILQRHARTISKRRSLTYDTPKLTAYALRLVVAVDNGPTNLDAVLHAATTAAEQHAWGLSSHILHGTRQRQHGRLEDGDTFNDFYLLGSAVAAAHPRRSCDRSGIRSCQHPAKRYNTTNTTP